VVLLAREPRKAARTRDVILERSANAEVEVLPCDLASLESVRMAAGTFVAAHPRLDGLAHCAAVFLRRREVTAEGHERMLATNHLGPFLLTERLLPALQAGAPARVVTVTAPSTTELDFADLESSHRFRPLHAFGATKSANLLFAYELARRTQGSGITSNAFFPGVVKSGLMREAPAVVRGLANLAGKRPDEAGEALAWLLVDPSVADVTGRFYKGREPTESSPYSRDPAVQRRLWEESERLAGR
jgi:NAD(P)-dependent dehydrogenase (short-subunit alcohol dehydrogenase family)